MILKKPYAFIIKHFRIIHLLLLIPIIFIMNRTRMISTFLSSYVKNNYTFYGSAAVSNLASEYISIWMYLVIILILAILIILVIVLQKKDKPVKFYHFTIIYYIILIILLTGSFSIFTLIERDALDEILARLFKDISWVVYASEFIIVFMMLIRASGFNIRKFNFQKDLLGLEVSSEDSEEFEFLVGTDSYKYKRSIRRGIRELKYYILENKFILTVIVVVGLLILGISLYRGKEASGSTFKEGMSIPFGYVNFTVKDSYISTIDMSGNEINKDKAYVILQIELKNRYREDKEFNYSNMQLVVNNKYFSPNLYYGNFFLDYGVPYNGTLIKGNTEYTYVLVYEIPKNFINNKLQINSSTNYGNNIVDLSPTIVNESKNIYSINKGTKINLSATSLKNTTLAILDYSFMNRFLYKYKSCITSSECYEKDDVISLDLAKDYNKILMIIDYALTLDTESSYMNGNKTYQSFFNDFMSLKYTINGEEKTIKPSIVNPSSYADKLILKVPKELSNADNFTMVIGIGKFSYNITLK